MNQFKHAKWWRSYLDKLWQSFWKLKFMKIQALELHSPFPKSFKVCKERTMEKRKTDWRKQRGQQMQSSFAILEHFPKSIFYMLYTISKIWKSRIQRFKPCTIWSWNEEDMAFGSQLLQACAKISHDTLCCAKFAQHLQNLHSPCVVRILLCFFRLHFRYFLMYFFM